MCSKHVKNVNVQRQLIASPRHRSKIFGTELTTFLTTYNSNLPFVVTKCTKEIETRGLATPCIYRLHGRTEQVDAIRNAFERAQTDLSQERCPDIHTVAAALKLYLRELPTSLITSGVLSLLIDAIKQDNLQLKTSSIKQALLSLPKAHYDTLKYVMEHLHRVSLKSTINQMNPHNLAIIFACNLLIIPDATMFQLNITQEIEVMETLIAHCHLIFN